MQIETRFNYSDMLYILKFRKPSITCPCCAGRKFVTGADGEDYSCAYCGEEGEVGGEVVWFVDGQRLQVKRFFIAVHGYPSIPVIHYEDIHDRSAPEQDCFATREEAQAEADKRNQPVDPATEGESDD